MVERLRIPEGWSTFILAWALVLISGYTIWQADLTNGLQVLMLIGTAAYVSGYFLARSSFSSRIATIFSLVYGLFLITYLIGNNFLAVELTWPERVADLVGRQQEWLIKAFSGGTSRDRLIFVMHTSVIFWVLGHTAAWYTFRQPRLWRVVLPSGIVLLSVVYYYFGPKPLWLYLALYILVALLYVARTFLITQEASWREAVVRYERAITFNFLRAGFLVGMFALMGAWMLPTLSANAAVSDALGGVNRPWRDFQDNWTRLFSSLRAYGTGTNDAYGTSLSLGGPRNVSDTLVMDVFVKERLPFAYWQAGVFESYEDGRWSVPDGERTLQIPDDGLVNVPLHVDREIVSQTVRSYVPNTGTLFGMPDPVGSDQQMFVTQQYDARGASMISLLQSRFVLQQGDSYEMQSRVSVADIESLQRAGSEYPEWIDPYLQIPDTITPETLALAEELTAPYDNVYDKAIVVRDYLRDTIEYNDQIQAAPEGVDPVHYVLFDLQEGYCNYYASAMAIMLRAQGIPARVAVGYAAGEFVEDSNVYRVRASDAHTWVEVYFPRYGWIQFEPTASITVVNRPLRPGEEAVVLPPSSTPFDEGDFAQEDDFLDPNERLNDPSSFGAPDGANASTSLFSISDPVRFWRSIAAVAVFILAGVALYLANILNVRVETDVVESFSRLHRWSNRWLGLDMRPTHTPYEQADILVTAVPEGRKPIRNLTQQFVQHTFSPIESNDEYEPQAEWKELRPILLRHSLLKAAERARSFWRRRRPRLYR